MSQVRTLIPTADAGRVTFELMTAIGHDGDRIDKDGEPGEHVNGYSRFIVTIAAPTPTIARTIRKLTNGQALTDYRTARGGWRAI